MAEVKRLSCEEAVREFFAYLDRALAGDSLDALEAHLETCLDCCDRLDFSRSLDAFAKTRLDASPLPEGVADRIRRAIRG
ncbi:MAG TPA: zf-HC2 domain-containing protein [Vicinamibacteria bacterium]|nr:zf-HC2 domain-containing protein [Vicinamibacteria bacterium]